MADNFFTVQSVKRQIANHYWQPVQPVGAPVTIFYLIKYLTPPNAVLDFDEALSGARLDCGRHLKLLI